MTEKNGKAKTRKGGGKAGADPAKSVMGNLSSTRPTRMGRHREASPEETGTTSTAAPSKARAAARPAAPKTAAKPRTAPKAAAKPRAAVTAARAKDGPRAVRSGSPSLERPHAKPASPKARQAGPPKGTELVTTAVQATAELAQIGFTLGGQMVKRAVNRIPKP